MNSGYVLLVGMLYFIRLGSGNDSSYTATIHFSYIILANPEMELHALDTYQSKQVPGGDIKRLPSDAMMFESESVMNYSEDTCLSIAPLHLNISQYSQEKRYTKHTHYRTPWIIAQCRSMH